MYNTGANIKWQQQTAGIYIKNTWVSLFFMALNKQKIQIIRDRFATMQNVEELVQLLNFAKGILYPPTEKTKPIQLKSVTFYANFLLSQQKRYKSFSIKKKSGGERIISAPHPTLKLIQRCLNLLLTALYEPHQAVMGFVPNRNIVENAKVHVGKKYVFNIDLKDFFPSIELHRIKAVLKLPPFNLNEDREKLAYMIANLCCHVTNNEEEILPKYKVGDGYDLAYFDELKSRAFLPQGAPTSPVLSNIICQKLDRRLNGLAKKVGVKYTRYADDITFSADSDVFNLTFKAEMRRIVEEQRFIINEKKVRLQGIGYKQEVTGLVVNEKVNVSKKYVREIRTILHNWEKLGEAEAEKVFLSFYIPQKGHIKKGKPNFRNVLWGKLQFLAMVRGKEDVIVMRYIEQYNRLNPKPITVDLQNLSLADILAVWETNGIEKAMELYYSNFEGDAKN